MIENQIKLIEYLHTVFLLMNKKYISQVHHHSVTILQLHTIWNHGYWFDVSQFDLHDECCHANARTRASIRNFSIIPRGAWFTRPYYWRAHFQSIDQNILLVVFPFRRCEPTTSWLQVTVSQFHKYVLTTVHINPPSMSLTLGTEQSQTHFSQEENNQVTHGQGTTPSEFQVPTRSYFSVMSQ